MSDTVAKPADWFQNGFHRFLIGYLRRHFHAIAVEQSSLPREHSRQSSHCVEKLRDASMPVLVYSNHPSWWDPLLAHFLNRKLLSPRQFYAPIDAEALQQYKVFERLGFFGVDLQSTRGAAKFLKTTMDLFERSHSALWLTPEGRFADVRDQTVPLMPGLAHLCRKLDDGVVVPLSLEYVFWEERLPECLIRFGQMMAISDYPSWDKHDWTETLQNELRNNQQELSKLVIARSAEPFENVLTGHQGARGIYDWSRRVKSWWTGNAFRASHGTQFSSSDGTGDHV